MISGYKIRWTKNAKDELKTTFEYLEQNWSDLSVSKLAIEVERTVILISRNPKLFQESCKHPEIRRAVILKHNSMYYRENGDLIEILSFFANRQHPDNRNL